MGEKGEWEITSMDEPVNINALTNDYMSRDLSTCINNLNIDVVDANNDFPSADDDINDREDEYVHLIIHTLMGRVNDDRTT
jgi:hypothetical protein